jgi:hypothetical protein
LTRRGYWIAWAVAAIAATIYLGSQLTMGNRSMFVPGRTTAGHYQIEVECATCHTPFQGVSDAACVSCHGAELTAVDDSHPKSKFTDPRNADRVKALDARSCIACHREHAPEITRPMGVTLPDDLCVLCHSDVGAERPSHAGMAFDTCASAACHNYHDNTALYEDFLVRHAGEPAVLARPAVARRNLLKRLTAAGPAFSTPLQAAEADAPPDAPVDARLLSEWESTAHARAGVNCTGCHVTARQGSDPVAPARSGAWTDRPTHRECAACHELEVDGFLESRHGMRLERGLPPMRPNLARLPMKSGAGDVELSCGSCHSAHTFDTRRAASTACLTCHDDRHSLAFVGSPHGRLWSDELEGRTPAGSGVSCATCHLPREPHTESSAEAVFVQHNQNRNLRPNEKMVRTVCLSCHGLEFTLDALADPRLIETNFTGQPARHVDSVGMAGRRIQRQTN